MHVWVPSNSRIRFPKKKRCLGGFPKGGISTSGIIPHPGAFPLSSSYTLHHRQKWAGPSCLWQIRTFSRRLMWGRLVKMEQEDNLETVQDDCWSRYAECTSDWRQCRAGASSITSLFADTYSGVRSKGLVVWIKSTLVTWIWPSISPM